MKISNLLPENKGLYCVCFESWSTEMKEEGEHKDKWYEQMKNKGLRVKFIHDELGIIAGMIQYVPIEYSIAKRKDLYFIKIGLIYPLLN